MAHGEEDGDGAGGGRDTGEAAEEEPSALLNGNWLSHWWLQRVMTTPRLTTWTYRQHFHARSHGAHKTLVPRGPHSTTLWWQHAPPHSLRRDAQRRQSVMMHHFLKHLHPSSLRLPPLRLLRWRRPDPRLGWEAEALMGTRAGWQMSLTHQCFGETCYWWIQTLVRK